LGLDYLADLNLFSLNAWEDLCMQFYRRNLPHLQRDFKPHFITFVTKFRWVLPDWARDIALSACCHEHRGRYELNVAVVMPDHVHMILTPLIDEKRSQMFSLIEIMRGMKGAAGRKINQRMGRHGAVWQEESFDHVLRASERLDAKIEYILQNPVRKGLVEDWREYRWVWKQREPDEAKMTIRKPAVGQNM
jgi:REP element-mobilizing transposase RayT